MRLRGPKRVVLYLTPQVGTFVAGLVLGDRALAVARDSDLAPEALKILDEAKRYAEGTGVRIPVRSLEDCSSVETLARAKMET